MKKISIFLVIVLLGCQDVITPSSPSMTDAGAGINNSKLSSGSSMLQNSLTDIDRKNILSNLERSGHFLTSEQLDALIQFIDATIPIVYSLIDQIPPSLRYASREDWQEIAKHDAEAAAFVLKVETEIQDKLKTELPPDVFPCALPAYTIFMCLYAEVIICQIKGEGCPSLGTFVNFFQCVYENCQN